MTGILLTNGIMQNQKKKKKKIEFRESDVTPGKTEVKQGKFVQVISPAKGYSKETYRYKT